jgi:hypothetical protein
VTAPAAGDVARDAADGAAGEEADEVEVPQ